MITRSELGVQISHSLSSWQEQLAHAISSPKQLLSTLQLDLNLLPTALRGAQQFPMKVPHAFVERMKKGDPNDPLLKQVLPLGEESDETPGFSLDPLAEQHQNPTEGVIHKYQGRLLLIVSGACAINCRFCFRRHFPYQDNNLGGDKLSQALDYIRSDQSIREVILSGGDPLAANDKRLRKIVEALSDINHVETLRIHTRLPVVMPNRITDDLIHWLTTTRLTPVMVIHCNHAQEIDDHLRSALQKLRNAGVTLLNQTVLLKGINDSSDALIKLSQELFSAGVLPYYLHLLDPVQGAAHFDVPEKQAKAIMTEIMAHCPGYLVPKLVREIPGKPGKTWI